MFENLSKSFEQSLSSVAIILTRT